MVVVLYTSQGVRKAANHTLVAGDVCIFFERVYFVARFAPPVKWYLSSLMSERGGGLILLVIGLLFFLLWWFGFMHLL